MRNTYFISGLVLAATLLLLPLAAAQVTTSQLGYHPDQYKQVVVYTDDSVDSFELFLDNTSVYIGNLTSSTCQGEQACLVGDFSSFTQEGVYTAYVDGFSSKEFRIDSSVYADTLPIFAEFFNALRMQGSSYHPDHHAAANPPLPMIADGSFILTTQQAALTLIRLGQAYEHNPSALGFSVYEERPDIAVYIKEYVDFLTAVQDYDGQQTVPQGWYYEFNCPMDYTLQEGKHNQEQDNCLIWDNNSDSKSVVSALTSYTHALPAITAVYGEQAGEQLLERAIRTDAYIHETYTNVASPGSHGAALFILYDFTNESTYLTRAYELRDSVKTSLNHEWTAGEELYWNEYIKHEEAIHEIGTYEVNNNDPRDFFKKQTSDNWNRISEYGDYATSTLGRNFQHSRPMLLAAVQAEFSNQHLNFPEAQRVSESQIAWLTGQNRVHWQGEGMHSRSFIFGIGETGINQHIRLVQPNFFEEGQEWLNGKTHIDGWVVGAFDNSGDGLLEYDDRYYSWRYTESTNHMVALGVLAFAQLDARYNDQQPLTRPYLNVTVQPINDTGSVNDTDDGSSNACYETLRSLPVTCSAGDILIDSTDGSCREIVCQGAEGSIEVLACDKPDGYAQHFEMYKQNETGTPPEICLADACMQEEGMVKSDDYPICPFSDDAAEENVSLEVTWSAPAEVVLEEEIDSTVTVTNKGNTSFEDNLSYYFNQEKQEVTSLLNLSIAPGENQTVLVRIITQPIGTFTHSIRDANGTHVYAEQELTIQEQTTQEDDNTQNQQPTRRGGGGSGGFFVEQTPAPSEENTSNTPPVVDEENASINESQEELVNTTQEVSVDTTQEAFINEEAQQETTAQAEQPTRNFLTGAVTEFVEDTGVAGWLIAFILAGIAGILLLYNPVFFMH